MRQRRALATVSLAFLVCSGLGAQAGLEPCGNDQYNPDSQCCDFVNGTVSAKNIDNVPASCPPGSRFDRVPNGLRYGPADGCSTGTHTPFGLQWGCCQCCPDGPGTCDGGCAACDGTGNHCDDQGVEICCEINDLRLQRKVLADHWPVPCNYHDACYETCGAGFTQEFCDDGFLQSMQESCDTLPPAQVPACYAEAQIGYQIVKNVQGAYESGQNRGCQCCRDLFSPGLTDNAAWHNVEYYSTIRTVAVDDDIYLIARASSGIVAYRLDTETQIWTAIAGGTGPPWSDAGLWNNEQYYSTIRAEVIGDDIWLVARASSGLVMYKLDTANEVWSTEPDWFYAVMTDAQGWDQPQYYKTIRTEVADGDLFVFGRSSAGITTRRFDTGTETWSTVASATAPPWSDAGLWNNVEYYSTIRTEVVGDDVYLIGRASSGVVTYRLDTTAPEAWSNEPFLAAMTDAQGWNLSQYYGTIRTEVVGQNLFVFGRSDSGIVSYMLDTSLSPGGTWTAVGVGTEPPLTDEGLWDNVEYYATIRTEVVGDDVYLVARASSGLVTYKLDTITGVWSEEPFYAVMTDAQGWNAPQYYTTIRLNVVGGDLFVLGRASSGIVTHAFQPSTDVWRAIIGAAGRVPNSLSVAKAGGGDLTLSWGASCLPSDTDYAVYEGSLGDFASHLPVPGFCSTLGATTATISPDPGGRYYLVVPQGPPEGSYGYASGGIKRPASLSACQVQRARACP